MLANKIEFAICHSQIKSAHYRAYLNLLILAQSLQR